MGHHDALSLAGLTAPQSEELGKGAQNSIEFRSSSVYFSNSQGGNEKAFG